jgi:hypothetical protein
MKKRIVQYFDAPLELVLKSRQKRWDELEKIPDLRKAEELVRRDNGDTIYIERESSASSHVPENFRKYISPDMLKWKEMSTWHKSTNIHEWRVVPTHYERFLDVRGRTIYEEIEAGDGIQTRRTLDMNLKVRLPVLGALAEAAIFEAFSKNFQKDYEAIRERVLEYGGEEKKQPAN